MIITAIAVRDYGPLRDFRLQPDRFEIIYGLNESGKTALVEALSYILFRRDLRALRYGKPVDISVEISEYGRSHTLPSKKTGTSLPTGELSNLLYVQASDSGLFRDETGPRFWDDIKLMMSKIESGMPFSRLGEKVMEGAGMTAKGRWKENKLKVIECRKTRKKELENFIGESDAVEQSRKEFLKLKKEHEVLSREIAAIEYARKYGDYKTLVDLHAKYVDRKNELADYARFDEKQLEEWRALAAEKAVKAEFAQVVRDTDAALPGQQRHLEDLRRTERIIGDGGFKAFLTAARGAPARPSPFAALTGMMVSLMVLVLSWRFKFSVIVPVAGIAASVVLGLIYLFRRAQAMRFELEQEMWLNKARLIFPAIRSLAELPALIEQVIEERVRCETMVGEKLKNCRRDDLKGELEKIEERITDLRRRTGLNELTQLKEQLQRKAKISADIEGIKARIASLIREDDETKWKRLIDEKKVDPPDGDVGLARYDEKLARAEKLKEKIETSERAIRVFEETSQRIYGSDDAYRVLSEIEEIERELKGYELEEKAARKAFEILREMSGELDDFIEEIASQGAGSLSASFLQVTGKYNAVKIVNHNFIVRDQNGAEYAADKLSSGTRDQLLLCFRIAALKKLYPAGIFLLLDDAFVFADEDRRRRLVELVKDFSREPNQVIYLTSDRSSRDIFKESGAHVTELLS